MNVVFPAIKFEFYQIKGVVINHPLGGFLLLILIRAVERYTEKSYGENYIKRH